MPRVMIRCPDTDKPLPTGGAMDKESFEGRRYTNYEVECPHCGRNHPVTGNDNKYRYGSEKVYVSISFGRRLRREFLGLDPDLHQIRLMYAIQTALYRPHPEVEAKS